jgi:hypothetical protein
MDVFVIKTAPSAGRPRHNNAERDGGVTAFRLSALLALIWQAGVTGYRLSDFLQYVASDLSSDRVMFAGASISREPKLLANGSSYFCPAWRPILPAAYAFRTFPHVAPGLLQ